MRLPEFRLSSLLSRRMVRDSLAMILDLFVALSAFLLAYVTIFTFRASTAIPYLSDKIVLFAGCAAASFFVFKLFRGSWRYVSIPDLLTIVKAAVATTVAFTVVTFLISRGAALPRSVLVLSTLYLIAGLAGTRIAYRISIERAVRLPAILRRGTNIRRVVLCGYSDTAESFIRASRRGGAEPLEIAAILDDLPSHVGRSIHGVEVLGSIDDLDRVLRRVGGNVSELIVTGHGYGRKRLLEIVEAANAHNLKVSRIPDFTETSSLTGDLVLEPKPIEVGDLLDRPEIRADLQGVASLISGRTVLVTGAGGSIGSELSRQIAAFGPRRLLITDSSEFHLFTLDTELRDVHPGLNLVARLVDIRDANRVRSVFAEFRPEVVFHAAALKHVPLVEDNPLEAVKTNVIGTRNAADAALANDVAAFVMISTDKAVNPTNVMGATKRAAEAYCQSLDVTSETTRFKTVRFGNVLGSNGSVVPRFKEQIAAGGPVTVTHPEIARFFMTIPEAVMLVLNASARALARPVERGRIMVLDMGKQVRIVDLARRMIQLAGFRPGVDIDIVFTGLRPGEKLFEELFDPSEIRDGDTGEGYFHASPRIVDRSLIHRTLSQIETCIEREDRERAVQLLRHLVPEFQPGDASADRLPAPPATNGQEDQKPAGEGA